MIKSVHMKNFRQHRDLSLDFSQGTSVIRAANEAGKSTVFEAISYAMFGARSARNSDLTTWGEPENTHLVMLTLDVNGTEYHIKRSARSAEVNYEGGRVTGQGPTVQFIEQLLELKPGTGTKLMMVPQNEMRGTLTDGGAKTTAMIEQLADLGQIDAIITKLQENWHTGKTDWLESDLAQAQARHQALLEDIRQTPHPDDVIKQKRDDLQRQLPDAQRTLADKQQQLSVAERMLNGARQAAGEYESLSAELTRTRAHLASVQREYNNLPEPVSGDALHDARSRHAAVGQQQKTYDDYRTLSDWRPSRVACNREAAQEEYERLRKAADESRAEASRLEVQISEKQSHINNDLACPACKRRWENADEREAHNQQLRHEIDNLQPMLQAARQLSREVSAAAETYRVALSERLPVLTEGSLWQPSNEPSYPPVYVWTGGDVRPTTAKEVGDAWRTVQQLEQAEAKAKAIQARRTELSQQFEPLEDSIRNLSARLSEIGDRAPDISQPQKSYDECRMAVLDVERHLADVQRSLDTLDDAHQHLYVQYQARLEALADAESDVVTHTQRLAEAHKANSLLKALRAMRPTIANQVWQSVCQSISHYFSIMRGASSVVSRETHGFTVDGRDTTSLSGSTLDILGLAIRVALTKTFMPVCDFLLLDEPFAAADAERTAQALGFLQTIGFDQVVLITHEDTTEAVADHLITL